MPSFTNARRFIVVLINMAALFPAHAQTSGENLDKVSGIYDIVFRKNKKADSAGSNLSLTKLKVAEASPLLDYIAKNGSLSEQGVGRWLAALMKYELAFSLSNAGENEKAYSLCKEARDEIISSASLRTELSYTAGGMIHRFPVAEISRIRTESTDILAGISGKLKKYDEAIALTQEAQADQNMDRYKRYQGSGRIWYARKQKQQFDSLYVKAALNALRDWSRIDTADKRFLRENNYYRGSSFSYDLQNLLARNIAGTDKAATARSAAFYLDSVHEINDAKYFYGLALSIAPGNKSVLWQALDFAERENLSEMTATINAAIEKAYANEPDESIRNLGRILPKIVASANDPARHLEDLKTKTFKCPFFHDKVYRSTLEFPHVLSTCIWEFFKNDRANYFEWMSYMDEEKSKGLDQKGPLRLKYNAVCAEVKNIYPDIPVIYTYNDDKYFSMQVSAQAKIDVHIYGAPTTKDILSLTVTSEMPKNVP